AAPAAPTAPAAEAAPAAVDLGEEIGELEFFVEQGLLADARAGLERLLAAHPGEPRLLALRVRLRAGGEAPAEASPAAIQAAEAAESDADAIDSIDLASELAQDLEQAADADDDYQISFQNVFDEFKRGVAEQVADSDHETHYNLGIAYREMGLLNDAIRELT